MLVVDVNDAASLWAECGRRLHDLDPADHLDLGRGILAWIHEREELRRRVAELEESCLNVNEFG